MKTTILFAVIFAYLCLVTTNTASAARLNQKYDSLSCLQIEGRVTNLEGITGECLVELIGSNTKIDSVILKDSRKKFSFILNRNSYYAIRISKKGYVSKLVCINTEIDFDPNALFRFHFDTELIPESLLQKLNKDVVDFPVAIIYFNYETNCFCYSKSYTANIKKELYLQKATTCAKG